MRADLFLLRGSDSTRLAFRVEVTLARLLENCNDYAFFMSIPAGRSRALLAGKGEKRQGNVKCSGVSHFDVDTMRKFALSLLIRLRRKVYSHSKGDNDDDTLISDIFREEYHSFNSLTESPSMSLDSS